MKRWTPTEIQSLHTTVSEMEKAGRTRAEAFTAFAHKSGRSEAAISQKYYESAQTQSANELVQPLVKAFSEKDAQITALQKRIAELEEIETEYTKLVQIIDKARRAAFSQDEAPPRFKMTKDGTLERVD